MGSFKDVGILFGFLGFCLLYNFKCFLVKKLVNKGNRDEIFFFLFGKWEVMGG